ncbi:dihydroorotate dehydrogenase [Candidatus Woesearchaeota archaeon]|nr:dihydroorotate dehydrogenase [Candidatus Woesearchaeota archaeon]
MDAITAMVREKRMNFLLEDRIKLATVSGIFTTKPAMIEFVDEHIPEIEMITSKSYQVRPNPGNREIIIVEDSVGNFGNAVGLRNPGMEKGYEELYALLARRALRAYLDISLSADSIDDFAKLIKKFEPIADFLELNFSCPHAKEGFGASIGSDARIVAEYMKELRKVTDAILIPKLTPNVDNIGEIALAAVENGADAIAAINTVGPVVYKEPHTGRPLLYNPKGHKGGKSGGWIKEVALEKIAEIRKAVEDDIPIIGMGGITTGYDVRRMREAGANVIGVGSVIARVVPKKRGYVTVSADLSGENTIILERQAQQRETSLALLERAKYISALKRDAEKYTCLADHFFVSKERIAEYKPYKITNIDQRGDNLRVFTLEGKIDYKSSQFVFIWVPDVGEKPFSIAKNDPLTFVVRRREYDEKAKKGLVTNALFKLNKGDRLMIRGVYGAEAPSTEKEKVCIVAGGTGIAVVPGLAKKLKAEGKDVSVYYGITSVDQVVLDDEIRKYAALYPITDNGTPGRAVDVMKGSLDNPKEAAFYNIGPVPLMKKAMKVQEELGASAKDIYASIETNNMCGIGMCSECVCGNRLTCQDGTFFSLEYLKEHKIDIGDFE